MKSADNVTRSLLLTNHQLDQFKHELTSLNMDFDVDRMVLDAITTIAGYNMVSQVLPTGQRLGAYFDKPKIFNELLSNHQAINFNLVAENQQITMQTLTKTTEYRVGLNISEGLGKPGKAVLLGLFSNGANPKLVIAFESPMGKRSKPFQIQDVDKVYVGVEDLLNSEMLVHVEILLQGPSIFIKLNVNADKWPFLICNKSSCVLHFGQTVINHSQKNNYGIIRLYESQPDSEMSYAWDEPAAGLESLIQVISLPRRDQGQSSSKPLPPVLLRELAFDVLVAGKAQVLVISDYNKATSELQYCQQHYG
ncbi:hypothetical protein O181_101848 [Austropuccinia psidii MF-1]|uniref:Vacuolar protein sorting-associated protein 13 VPS13 adaptor binding domain-containing protein n=1 Tax=Austropuccinia psidii MF-1 TaxID=1389203 RepID=A0A9Q3JF96_9BASI|nr:hypothetical protein [Austropuccinia psidii MF-1]